MSNPEPRITLNEDPYAVFCSLGIAVFELEEVAKRMDESDRCPTRFSDTVRKIASEIREVQKLAFLFHDPKENDL